MKLCFLAHASSIHTRYWTDYFVREGHEVSLISFTPGEASKGVALYFLDPGRDSSLEQTNWHYLRFLPRLWRLVRQLQPDILNAHFLSSYGVLGALVKPAGCPLVISLHGSDILIIPQRSRLHRLAARFALGRADLITSVAEHMTAVLRQTFAINVPTLSLQYGIQTDLFRPPAATYGREPICLSNRRLVALANIDTILEAAHCLSKEASPIQFVFSNWGELRPQMEAYAKELEMGARAIFLGRISREDTAAYLKRAALYVSMTDSDGTALSLLEALACGAFPVVSDIAANREWIEDGVNGFLVPLGHPAVLAERLAAAWQDETLRRRAAGHNWRLVQEKGEYEKNMGRIAAAFANLMVEKAAV